MSKRTDKDRLRNLKKLLQRLTPGTSRWHQVKRKIQEIEEPAGDSDERKEGDP